MTTIRRLGIIVLSTLLLTMLALAACGGDDGLGDAEIHFDKGVENSGEVE